MRCDTCDVMRRIMNSAEPACCKWMMDNVICGDKSVDDCPMYEKIKGERKKKRRKRNGSR